MFPTRKFIAFLFALLIAAGFVCGCSDDDPSAPNPASLPMLLNLSPYPDQTQVAVDAPIVITFSEAMDTEAVEQNVFAAQTPFTSMSWSAESDVLTLYHDPWTEKASIDMLIRKEATDQAGDALVEDFRYTFYTATPGIELLDIIEPETIGGEVPVNPVFKLLFNSEMDLIGLRNATTVVDGAGAKDAYPVVFGYGNDDWYYMRFPDDLPASTTFTVNISTAATAYPSGKNLTTPVQFQFTTGMAVDSQPPHIVSVWPETGSFISPTTNFMKITFDEAVDLDSFIFSAVNVDMLVKIESRRPYLTPDGKILYLYFGEGDLMPGTFLELALDDFADVHGNVQNEDFIYSITVAGEPDYYPADDGRRLQYRVYDERGTVGTEIPESTNSYWEYQRIASQGNGVFNLEEYHDYLMTETHSWDIMKKTSSEIQMLGFHDYEDEGKTGDIVEYDVLFDDPLTWMKLPPRVSSWNDATTATDPDQNTVDLVIEGAVIGMAERTPCSWFYNKSVAAPSFLNSVANPELEVYWKNLWLSVITHTISCGDETIATGTDSIWYSPGSGPVIIKTYEVDGGSWSRTEATFFPDLPM